MLAVVGIDGLVEGQGHVVGAVSTAAVSSGGVRSGPWPLLVILEARPTRIWPWPLNVEPAPRGDQLVADQPGVHAGDEVLVDADHQVTGAVVDGEVVGGVAPPVVAMAVIGPVDWM